MWISIIFIFFFSSIIRNSSSQPTKCLPGIQRFSAEGPRTAYYQCENDIPIKKFCEEGRVYSMKRQKCVMANDQTDNLPLTEKALGRNFQLGSMYDARTNIFFPESSFWSQDVLKEKAVVYDRLGVEVDVTSYDRVMQRVSAFDISAKLAVDFMGGKVHVSGSGGFLKDEVTSEEESNVQMTYTSTKYTKTIAKGTRKSYLEECINDQFTHVVTSVTYGLNAVFAFKRLAQYHENKQNITGSLEISINLIPNTEISGHGSVDMTEWEQEMFNTTTLQVFGDFSPETKLPTTFEEAVSFYKQLPLMSGNRSNNWEGAQIVEVHLTPVTHMCTNADILYLEISNGMLDNVIKTMDELEELDIKVSGMMITREAELFNPLKVNLNLYRTALRAFTIGFKSQLQKILPNIRDSGNEMGEDALVDLIRNYTTSQFEYQTSLNFLIDRKRELQAIKYLTETVKDSNVGIADFEAANDVEYVFRRDKLVLLELNILSDTANTQSFLDGNTVDESDFWYNKPEVNGLVGSLLRRLKTFSEVNVDDVESGFMVKLAPFQDTPIFTNALLQGYLKSDQFINPPRPPPSSVHWLTNKGFKFMMIKPNEFVTKLEVAVKDVLYDRTHFVIQKVPGEVPVGTEVEVLVEGLEPAHVYSYNVRYLTELGTGPVSPSTSTPFTTRPTSPAQDLLCQKITHHDISVIWQPPAFLLEGVTSSNLIYRVTVEGSNGFESVHVTEDNNFTLENPAAATEFTFTVVSVLKKDLEMAEIGDWIHKVNYTRLPERINITHDSNPVSVIVTSLPNPPKMIQVLPEEVDMTSALVKWTPSPLAPGAELVHYILEYNSMNENGTEDFSGTEHSLVVPGTELPMEGLTPGSLYSFRVKAVTTKGDSEFSTNLLFLTEFDSTGIEATKQKLLDEIEKLRSRVQGHVAFCSWWNPSGTSTLFLQEDTLDTGSSMSTTGEFTAGRPGLYQVSFSPRLTTNPSEHVKIWIKHNDDILQETKVHSYNDITAFNPMTESSSRSLVLSLLAGETVKLSVDNPADIPISNVPFCVSSSEIY